jgi:hypothetical protein
MRSPSWHYAKAHATSTIYARLRLTAVNDGTRGSLTLLRPTRTLSNDVQWTSWSAARAVVT